MCVCMCACVCVCGGGGGGGREGVIVAVGSRGVWGVGGWGGVGVGASFQPSSACVRETTILFYEMKL